MLTQNREHSRTLSTAYRNYSRMRYDQIKQTNKSLRESDIVGKVIKEWEAMNQNQKTKYVDSNMNSMVTLNVEPLATPQKDALGKSNQKSTSVKVDDDMSLDNVEVKEFDLSSDSANKKTKKISKKSQSEYLSFFKYHFKKLHEEHKKWSSKQISSIIRLLWHKKKNMNKPISMRTRSVKEISGRKFFLKMKKEEGMSVDRRMKMWKHMPLETRKMWKMKGNPSMKSKPLSEMTMKMNLSSQMESGSNMHFLRNKMM